MTKFQRPHGSFKIVLTISSLSKVLQIDFYIFEITVTFFLEFTVFNNEVVS